MLWLWAAYRQIQSRVYERDTRSLWDTMECHLRGSEPFVHATKPPIFLYLFLPKQTLGGLMWNTYPDLQLGQSCFGRELVGGLILGVLVKL